MHVLAVANRALAQVDRLGAMFSFVFEEGSGPCHLIGIDVKDVGVRIHGGASPLRSAVEAGEHSRFGSHSKGNELAFVNRSFEPFCSPLMSLRSASRQHVLGEILPCVGRGPCRQTLLGGSNFTRKHACGVLTILDRDQRLARSPIEDK